MLRSTSPLAAVFFAAVPLFVIPVSAEVQVYPLFTDDMVLQRDKPAPVWGTARPEEKVTVSIGAQQQTTAADAAGHWKVTLKPMPAARSLTLRVKGENEASFKNVAVGDVYICSGQSNMDWRVSDSKDAVLEIAAADYPEIRFFTVPKRIGAQPLVGFNAPVQWQLCGPRTVAPFSAVAYFFGRELNRTLNVPIGLINPSWGGTIAQAWTSRDTLVKRDDLREVTLASEKKILATTDATIARDVEEWKERTDDGAQNGWQTPQFDDSGWPVMKVPANWEENGLPDFDGTVWFRKRIEIPAQWAGKALTLHPGVTDDIDTTYWNGTRIGFGNQSAQVRHYPVPAELVKAGAVTVAIRINDFNRSGGLTGGDDMRIELQEDAAQKIDISGEWRYHTNKTVKEWPPGPGDIRYDNSQPSVLYNGMIAPLLPFAVRGVIWYQGESDTPRPGQYQTLFPDLIRDWRARWNAKQNGSEFGFYYVQIANYLARSAQPIEPGWAELREAQTMALKVPRTGMATILDIGEGGNIHPPNKQDVGKRLALIALAKEYGRRVEYSGPMMKKVKMPGGPGEIKIQWMHGKGLRTTDGQPPRTFAILGEDEKWYTPRARIEGETVILTSEVKPVAVRYAWSNNPDVNLVNDAGLPAVSFRTDGAK